MKRRAGGAVGFKPLADPVAATREKRDFLNWKESRFWHSMLFLNYLASSWRHIVAISIQPRCPAILPPTTRY